jgi:CubicO group peptidase (beta-lactamase class C family)
MILGSACSPTTEALTGPTETSAVTTTVTAGPIGVEGTLVPYPDAAWPVAAPQDHGLEPAEVEDLANYFSGINSNCMAVIKDGYLVASRYWNGTTADTNQETWSISKSITSTLVGIAQDQGLLDIDEPASTYIDSWKGTPSESVTIRNLVSNDSGRYYDPKSDLVELAVVAEDKTAYAVGLEQQQPPGEYWEYNSSAIQTLEAVLEAATGQTVEAFAQANLFGPIGMSATILDDAAGNDLTFMGTQAGCDDIARFGYLTLHGGAWNGEQVVSEAWTDEATTASQDLMTGYGFLWWLNTDGRRFNRERVVTDDGSLFLPSAPPDLIAAAGIQDQILLIAPSQDLVIVRLGGPGGPGDFVVLIDEIFRRLSS